MGRDANERGRKEQSHVRIYDAMQASDAWRALSGNAVKALLHVASFEKPKTSPNGTLFMSWGALGEAIGLNRKTAGRALQELVQFGFLRVTEAGHFSRKGGPANCYRLTWRAANGKPPSNEWRDWKPPAGDFSRVRKADRTGPKNGPLSDYEAEHGPDFGPVESANPQNSVEGVGPFIGPHTIASSLAFSTPSETPSIRPPESGRPNRGADILPFREAIAATCEQCAAPFLDRGRGAHPKRFCSERCRKAAERKRANLRAKGQA